MRRLVKRSLGAALVLIAAGFVWYQGLRVRAGETKTLEPVSAGVCTPIEGLVGAEDIVIDRERAVALISAYDRRAELAGEPTRGAIYAYGLAAPEPELVELTAKFDGPLRPHGIGLWKEPGRAVLFVVNHGREEEAIEIFDWTSDALVHRRTVTDELLISPNDVAPAGSDRFYATNDHGNRSPLGRTVEEYLQLRRANVVYFDGATVRPAAQKISYANGIALSPTGTTLYAAGTTRGRIHLFHVDPDSGELTRDRVLETGTGVDNIDVDRNGMLWVAAHPKLLTFVAHSKDPAVRSPSEVLWVDPTGQYEPAVRSVYLELGDALSGSSVAAAWGSRLLIGSVFEHALDCERDPAAVAAAR